MNTHRIKLPRFIRCQLQWGGGMEREEVVPSGEERLGFAELLWHEGDFPW